MCTTLAALATSASSRTAHIDHGKSGALWPTGGYRASNPAPTPAVVILRASPSVVVVAALLLPHVTTTTTVMSCTLFFPSSYRSVLTSKKTSNNLYLPFRCKALSGRYTSTDWLCTTIQTGHYAVYNGSCCKDPASCQDAVEGYCIPRKSKSTVPPMPPRPVPKLCRIFIRTTPTRLFVVALVRHMLHRVPQSCLFLRQMPGMAMHR